MFYDASGPHGLKHNPFKALVAPRPIAWVSSISDDGVINLAPFSFFNAMADSPPVIVFAPNGPRPGGGVKDTLINIEETGEFVVNLCSSDLRDPMNTSSAHVGPEVDEFELAGLTPAPSKLVKPPCIAEAPAALECVHLMTVNLPSNHPKRRNNTVFGQVVGVHISDDIVKDGMVQMDKYQPLARLGYMDYSTLGDVFEMLRPD
jgi:flavin reductase (DIM6/NTAB) family NADH-FMN oxidoreductase RutF